MKEKPEATLTMSIADYKMVYICTCAEWQMGAVCKDVSLPLVYVLCRSFIVFAWLYHQSSIITGMVVLYYQIITI